MRLALLTGRDTARERRETLAALASGDIQIAIGTHALFQESVDLPGPRPCGRRRAAPLRRAAAPRAGGEGRAASISCR